MHCNWFTLESIQLRVLNIIRTILIALIKNNEMNYDTYTLTHTRTKFQHPHSLMWIFFRSISFSLFGNEIFMFLPQFFNVHVDILCQSRYVSTRYLGIFPLFIFFIPCEDRSTHHTFSYLCLCLFFFCHRRCQFEFITAHEMISRNNTMHSEK